MRRFLKSQSGQTAALVLFNGAAMMTLAAASVELGHIYYAYRLLVSSTDAAALAGAQAMPNIVTAATNVDTYSAETGDLNATPLLQNVVATPAFQCLGAVSGTLNAPCNKSKSASGGYNAVSVTQTAAIPLWFGGLVGMQQMNVSSTATAAMRGGQNTPWNNVIILDTTASMASSDSETQCSGTQISCALQGVRALLNDLDPCPPGETCTSSTAPVDSVSLFVFPPITSARLRSIGAPMAPGRHSRRATPIPHTDTTLSRR
jgi:hypothetical protein